MRLLPELTAENRAFWTGGATGELLITHCNHCNAAVHPPELICPHCLSRDLTPKAARGTGTIYSYTVNHKQWLPEQTVPFVIAVVDMDDEPGVRITGEMKRQDPTTVAIGQRVRTIFEHVDDVWIPQFEPLADAG